MKYISTRGNSNLGGFSDLLLEGLSADGGLAIPIKLPQITLEKLKLWRSLSYADLAFEILSLFIEDIPSNELYSLISCTYNSEAFNYGKDVVVLKPLSKNLFLLGLSQGPTLAFKDIAMQLLGNLFEYILNKRKLTLNVIGATSGDTGSAAEYALRNKKNISVFMLSPYGRMSAFQEAQMYSLNDRNIHNLAIMGGFDEAQDIVKVLSSDLEFKCKYRLGIVNSINWARIAAQVVYYFYGWLHSTIKEDQKISFAVPSGNFGNILAGYISRNMGLPIHRLFLVTNENNVLEEFFKTGIYRPRNPESIYVTSSPSMDISRASNLERFIFELVNKDSDHVKYLWKKLAKENFFDLSHLKHSFEEKHGFLAESSSHNDRIRMIKWAYENFQIILDPHTANAIKIARQFADSNIPILVLETAKAIKFPETINEALGTVAPRPKSLINLERLPRHYESMDNNDVTIKEYIKKHANLQRT